MTSAGPKGCAGGQRTIPRSTRARTDSLPRWQRWRTRTKRSSARLLSKTGSRRASGSSPAAGRSTSGIAARTSISPMRPSGWASSPSPPWTSRTRRRASTGRASSGSRASCTPRRSASTWRAATSGGGRWLVNATGPTCTRSTSPTLTGPVTSAPEGWKVGSATSSRWTTAAGTCAWRPARSGSPRIR